MLKFYKAIFFYWAAIILPFLASGAQENQSSSKSDILNRSGVSKRLALPESESYLLLNNNQINTSSFINFDNIMDQLRKSEYVDDMHNALKGFINRATPKVKKIISTGENVFYQLEEAFFKVVYEKENQILYPEWYSSMYNFQKTNNRILQQAHKTLDSNCADTDFLALAVSKLHPNYWPELQDKLKHKDKKLLIYLIQKLYKKLEQETYPKKCLDSANKNHKVCKTINQEVSIKLQRLKYLTELAYGRDISKTTLADAPCLSCVEGSLTKEINNVKNLLPILQQQILCSDPAPKGHKLVTNNSYLKSDYTIRKEQDGSFTLPLNLIFVAGKDYDGEVPKDKVPLHYKNKVQNCLKKANSKMLGPNGERLNIVLENPPNNNTDSCKTQKLKKIEIASSKHRASMYRYRSNVDCHVILHEVLHLTGLCDEYKEQERGFYVSDDGEIVNKKSYTPHNKNDTFVYLYDCRVTSSNSIMSRHWNRWNDVFEENKESSLLNPAQFNAILYGDCLSKNKFFNECVALAYKSSLLEDNKDCLKQKQKCMQNNVMGLDKTKELKRIQTRIETLNQIINKRKKIEHIIFPNFKVQTEFQALDEELGKELQQLKEELEMVRAWP